MWERFREKGFHVVYVGAYESVESCEQWKREFDLDFAVVPDTEGALFRRLSNGWVPFNLLVEGDGLVLFAENEFDEQEYSKAIVRALERIGGNSEPEVVTRGPEIKSSGAPTVVVLGGGTGGVVAAHRLRRLLPREHRVVLIDRSPDHTFSPSLLWLITGDRGVEDIRRPLDRLAKKGIEFHRGDVEEIDVRRRLVRTSSAEFTFDYLVIALGAELAPHSIPGFSEAAFNLYSVSDCDRLKIALADFTGGVIGIWIPQMPFKCPAAPYEAGFLIEALLRRKGVARKTEIHLLTPEHQPMPVAGKVLGEGLIEMMRSRGIAYHPLFTFKSLLPEKKEVVAGDGQSLKADLLIGVPPHQVPGVVRSAGLVGVSGWVQADPGTLQTNVDGVYAVGDITGIKLPNGKMLPKAGVFAHAQAEVVARRIAGAIAGTDGVRAFDGKGYCWVELGDGRAGFASGDFYADPEPQIRMHGPGRIWHWGKVAFEKWWLRHWF